MGYQHFNNNPQGLSVGDCVVRAISKILDTTWDNVYIELVTQGLMMSDMPSANSVWGSYLKNKGFKRSAVSNVCPDCYTVRNFVEEHPNGKFILSTGTHTVAAINGTYFDNWDSGDEMPIYYWYKEG